MPTVDELAGLPDGTLQGPSLPAAASLLPGRPGTVTAAATAGPAAFLAEYIANAGDEQPSEVLAEIMAMMAGMKTAIMDDVQAMVTDTDSARSNTEAMRSVHRNRNRMAVILVAWICSFIAPVILVKLLGLGLYAGLFSGSIGYSADLIVTAYAWARRY